MQEINNKKERMKKLAKKGAAVSFCAVLAGGLAAGAFEGVNYITGWNRPQNVQAANDNVSVALLKSDSDSSSDVKQKGSLDVSDIAAEAMPAVVSITTKTVQEVQSYYGMFGYGGYAPEMQEVESSGSGIIIGKNDEELLIVTNNHVVSDATTLSVCFADGNAYEAAIRGTDESKDLAVVSVELDDISNDTLKEITIAKIGSSDDLQVGEQVVAIGNALGYGQSVTTGIVSAKNRRMDSQSGAFQTEDSKRRGGVNLIQTDAAINPGNSGGALLNMNGEVVGINSAKLASTEVEGMGYAIAISDVSDILENLMNREKLEDGKHGVLGITGSTVSAEGVEIYGIPEGVFVSEITEGGGADEAGIRTNSVITSFDGKDITDINELVELLKYYEPGEEVEVTVQTPDGSGYKEETVTVKLSESPDASEEEDTEDVKNDEKDAKEDGSEPSDEEKGPNDQEERDSILKEWDKNFGDGNNTLEQFFGSVQ